jgi:hypothetical protein
MDEVFVDSNGAGNGIQESRNILEPFAMFPSPIFFQASSTASFWLSPEND